MNNRLPTIAIHLLGCLTFLALPYVFASNGLAKLAELPGNPHEQRNLVSYLLTIFLDGHEIPISASYEADLLSRFGQ